jgi:hypothetical protein
MSSKHERIAQAERELELILKDKKAAEHAVRDAHRVLAEAKASKE